MVAWHSVNFRGLVPAGSAEAYVFAILCVAAAALVRWVAEFWFEGVVPFATFCPAVLIPLWLAALGPEFLPL